MQSLLPLPNTERLEVFADIRGPRFPKGTGIPEKVRNLVAEIELGQLQPRIQVEGRSNLLYIPNNLQGQTNLYLWWATHLVQLSAVRVSRLQLSVKERQASEEMHMALGRGRLLDYFGPGALMQEQPQPTALLTTFNNPLEEDEPPEEDDPLFEDEDEDEEEDEP